MKAEQVGTEVERANDLIRSALRCVVAISRVDDVEVGRPAPPTRVDGDGGGARQASSGVQMPQLRAFFNAFFSLPVSTLYFSPSRVLVRTVLSTRTCQYFLGRPRIIIIYLFLCEIFFFTHYFAVGTR